MAAQAKRKRDTRASMVRIVSLSLAGLMLLSIILRPFGSGSPLANKNGAKGRLSFAPFCYAFSSVSEVRGISNQKVLPCPGVLSTP